MRLTRFQPAAVLLALAACGYPHTVTRSPATGTAATAPSSLVAVLLYPGSDAREASPDEGGNVWIATANGVQVLPADGGYQMSIPDPRTMAGRGLGLPLASLSPRAKRVDAEDFVPLGEVEVSRGDPVFATDGEIGRIHGLVVDPAGRHVSHVLLEEGHLWGRKEVAIPISAVAKIGNIVRLSISKQQVQDLPPVDIEHLPG